MIRQPLTAMGLWERFLECGPLESYAIQSAWEAAMPRCQESPWVSWQGPAWSAAPHSSPPVASSLDSPSVGKTPLATDLNAAGPDLVYADDVIVHHFLSPRRDAAARRRLVWRNVLWFSWLRRPAGRALRDSLVAVWQAAFDERLRPSIVDAVTGLPWGPTASPCRFSRGRAPLPHPGGR